MHIQFKVPFQCPENIRPFLEKVFAGEYEVPLFGAPLTILDLGANCGAFSVWASHRWPGSLINAYEPMESNLVFLERNIRELGLRGTVKIHSHAVGDPGMRTLHEGRHNCGEHSLHQGMIGDGTPSFSVPVLDPLTLPEANIIKIDTEGCELEILAPLIAAGRKFMAILVEYHHYNHRLQLDDLLSEDYCLIGAQVYSANIGVVKYLNKGLLNECKNQTI